MRLPDGEDAPSDGALPASAAVGAQTRAFGVYLHVPFCRVRCGYCDFNTYTSRELGGGADQESFARTASSEIAFAGRALRASGVPARPVSSVFFGGGTPTLLPASDLAAMLAAVRAQWGMADDDDEGRGVEVTTEANPDSVDAQYLAELAAAGFTRISFGVQSFAAEVLATLDRTHDPARVPQVVRWAREAGLAVSLDLIYGTPGETLSDWRRSLAEAIALEPDHVSAYALTVEPGTALHRRVARGDLPAPTGDDEADKYELADELLAAAGFDWYEISNWARTPADRCHHNLAYWSGADWWGVGPGAHSHVGGVRWWNVKHPRAYAGRLAAGSSPAAAREILDDEARALESVLLGTRLADGYALSGLTPRAARELPALLAEGLVTVIDDAGSRGAPGPRLRLTLRGRLLADSVVLRLTD